MKKILNTKLLLIITLLLASLFVCNNTQDNSYNKEICYDEISPLNGDKGKF